MSRNIKYYYLLSVSLIVLFTFLLSHSSLTAADNERPLQVSMIELIASGNNFDGKLVKVIGVPHLGFESGFLFYSKDAYEIGDTSSAVYIVVTRDDDIYREISTKNGEYLSITGVYTSIPRAALKKNQVQFGSAPAVGRIKVESYWNIQMIKD